MFTGNADGVLKLHSSFVMRAVSKCKGKRVVEVYGANVTEFK